MKMAAAGSKDGRIGADNMVQWVQVLATKSDSLGSIPRNRMVEGES